MKLLKNSMLGLAAAALMGGSASAATELHIAGSTAFRVSATAAIIGYLNAHTVGGVVYGAYHASTAGAGTNTGLFGAGQAIFTNSDNSIIIHTDWTGPLAGVVDLVSNNTGNLTFLPDAAITGDSAGSVVNLTAATPTYGAAVTTSESDTSAPNLAFSDSFASSIATVISGCNIDGAPVDGTTDPNVLASDITSSTITPAGSASVTGPTGKSIAVGGTGADLVGIVPFAWWTGNATTPPGITNMTQQAAYALTQGPIPVSMLNGVSSQKGNYVYLVGRNEDSGTRICALAESNPDASTEGTGIGTGAVQWQLTFGNPTLNTDSNHLQTGGNGNTDSTLFEWPQTAPLFTEPSIDWDTTGHSGYISGGDVKNVLSSTNGGLTHTAVTDGNAPPENTGLVYLIGYLGWADGYGITSTGHTPLTYNGVALSAANIQNGSYSFWSFEHCYYLTGSTNNEIGTGTAKAAADGIANNIITADACTDSTGNTASASYPSVPNGGVGNTDGNEDKLTTVDGAAPAGILYDAAVLTTRSVEGGILGANY